MGKDIKYVKNDNLPLIKSGFRGNVLINGRFSPYEEYHGTGFFKMMKWVLSKNPQKSDLIREKSITPVERIKSFEKNSIYWLGHSSFYINAGCVSFITDPVFFDLVTNKRDTPPPVEPADIKNIDYLLISHDHYDHLSLRSVSSLIKNNESMEALLPLNTGSLFDNCLLKSVPRQEAGWFQEYDVKNGVKVIFLPAAHWCRRGLFDMNKRLWGGFLIDTGAVKIYFAGDTAYNENMFRDIRGTIGAPDICLMPIGSYSPWYIMRDHHMNPEEAAAAFRILGGEIFIPMHYGTYTLSSEPAGEPPKRLKKVLDGKNTVMLNIGGRYKL